MKRCLSNVTYGQSVRFSSLEAIGSGDRFQWFPYYIGGNHSGTMAGTILWNHGTTLEPFLEPCRNHEKGSWSVPPHMPKVRVPVLNMVEFGAVL